MKIIYVSTTNLRGTPSGATEFEKRERLLKSLVSSGVEITLTDNPEGPPSIQTEADEFQAVGGLIKWVKKLETEYDAIILGCFADPGLNAIREIVSIPVIGPGASAMYLACQLGHNFSVLSPVESAGRSVKEEVARYGLSTKLTMIKALNIPVLEIRSNKDLVVQKATEVAKKIIECTWTDVIVLGCMSLAYQSIDVDLTKELDLPVVNPVKAAVCMAEAIVRLGLSTQVRYKS